MVKSRGRGMHSRVKHENDGEAGRFGRRAGL